MIFFVEGSEKREHKRIKRTFMARFGLYLQGLQHGPHHWDIVTLRDLSAGGTSFTYNKEIRLGATLKFVIPFPESREFIDCSGEAIRVVKGQALYRVAAHFTDIDAGKREIINRAAENIFYRKLLRMPKAPYRDISWVRDKPASIRSNLV
jgi:hypothetical protein